MSLNVSAILPASPVHEPGSRTEKSPARMVCRLARITAKSGETGSATRVECPLFLRLFSASEFRFAVAVAADRSLLFTVASWQTGNICPCNPALILAIHIHQIHEPSQIPRLTPAAEPHNSEVST